MVVAFLICVGDFGVRKIGMNNATQGYGKEHSNCALNLQFMNTQCNIMCINISFEFYQ